MDWKICKKEDIDELARLNRLLHEDEGAVPKDLIDAIERLRRWLASGYTAALFQQEGQTVAYALYRNTDKDSEGLFDSGIFLRQFYVLRDHRRNGVGRAVFTILREKIWPENCVILLDTVYKNHRAQQFWRSVGFSENYLSFIRMPSE